MSRVSPRKSILCRISEKTKIIPCLNPNLVGLCLIWTGGLSSKGYGRICFEGRTQQVHRVAYEALGYVIPEGKQLDHLCRVRACWNHKHVEPVTNKENVLRGIGISANYAARDRCQRGHLFVPGNLLKNSPGRTGRKCRECDLERKREYYHERKGSVLESRSR